MQPVGRKYFAAFRALSATVRAVRPLAVSLFALVAGCGAKMPVPQDLDAHAMELSISGPPTALEAGPFAVRAFRTISDQEADSVLGAAAGRADRTFAFELARGGEALRKVACRGYRRTTTAVGAPAEGAGLSCVVGTAGGNSWGRLTLGDASRGSLRLGADTFTVAPDESRLGTVVRRGDASVAAWQYSSRHVAWVASTADAELQASLVAAMAASIVYREFLSEAPK